MNSPEITDRQISIERDSLALDALHQLSAQFAVDSDFSRLVRSFLLTISGQFGVPGVVAVIRPSGVSGAQPTLFAVGSLDTPRIHAVATDHFNCWNCMQENANRCDGVYRKSLNELPSGYTCLRRELGVDLLIPLTHKRSVFGFIGVGRKWSGAQLNDDETRRLKTMVASVASILTNSYLLSDVTSTKQWYASLLDNIPQVVLVCDATGTLKLMNQAAMSLILSSLESMESSDDDSSPLVTDLLSHLDLPRAVSTFLTEESGPQPVPCSVVDRRAGRVYSMSFGSVLNSTSGRYDKLILLDDVSEARETEAHLLELEQLAERGSMVSSIAHEIRNVLAVMHGGVELSQIALKKGDTAKAEGYLSRVLDSARHMERFTLELMDARSGQAQIQPTMLNDLVSNVVTFLKVQRRFKAIQLTTELDPGMVPIQADTDQITQLLMNFVNNSADAIREAKRREGSILVQTIRESQHVVLEISDNGCGMPEEVRQKLFQQRFTTKEEGHGFGLVTCSKIISAHRANVQVESEPGVFTRIRVFFPHA